MESERHKCSDVARSIVPAAASQGIAKSTLPGSSQRLIELMSAIGFGAIESLVVHGGQPVFDPPPRVIRERLLGSDKRSHGQPSRGDFLLRSQVTELFASLAQIGDGVVQSLEVRHGLPFRLFTVEHAGSLVRAKS